MTDPNPDAPPPPPPKKQPGNWIDRLADRSTGLNSPSTPAQEAESREDQAESARLWRFGGLGLQMAGTIGLFWLMGFFIDRYMGWNHAAAITMTIIAVIGSTYLLIKEAVKANK